MRQMEKSTTAAPGSGIDDLVSNLDEPFAATLLRLINVKGKTDAEVYKRANLDRKLFSKIRTGKGYTPSKRTAIALAVALELSLDETDDLLDRAGYALSHAVKSDVIAEYFVTTPSSSTEARAHAREESESWPGAYRMAIGREPNEFVDAEVRYYLRSGIQDIVSCMALVETASAPAPCWRYTAAILTRCQREGVRTLEQWFARQERRQR